MSDMWIDQAAEEIALETMRGGWTKSFAAIIRAHVPEPSATDDDEPVPFLWFDGKAVNQYGMGAEWCPSELAILVDGVAWHVKDNPTKGDVRRLCRALCVEMKPETVQS